MIYLVGDDRVRAFALIAEQTSRTLKKLYDAGIYSYVDGLSFCKVLIRHAQGFVSFENESSDYVVGGNIATVL